MTHLASAADLRVEMIRSVLATSSSSSFLPSAAASAVDMGRGECAACTAQATLASQEDPRWATTQEQLHRSNYTGATTQEQLHRSNYTGAATQEQLHRSNYTGAATQEQLHRGNCTGAPLHHHVLHAPAVDCLAIFSTRSSLALTLAARSAISSSSRAMDTRDSAAYLRETRHTCRACGAINQAVWSGHATKCECQV